MDTVQIEYIDDVNLRVRCDSGIAQEISDYFTFFVPGYKFMPKFRNKMWDGKIRLFNSLTCLLYVGLLPRLQKFCKDREYNFIVQDERFIDSKFTEEDATKFITKLAPKLDPRDYQIEAFAHAVRKRRSLLLSPTASGKSFIIYLLARYFRVPTLIIVPTTTLVNQMYGDFQDYGFDSERFVHRIYSGHDKNTDKPIVVSTWQSIYKLPKQWFSRYKLVVGDEAHTFKAKSLTDIMTKTIDCPYKVGLTGTLDGTETNKLVLEGLFGTTQQVITTKELMDSGAIAKLQINALVLQYPDEIRKMASKNSSYDEEISFITSNPARLKFLKNLATSLEGNTFLMYRFVDNHGKPLYELIKRSTNRPVYFVSGEVSTDEREMIRQILEKETNSIVVCSIGTFATGVNVKNLHNIIFGHPSKTRIKVLQSIGRGLRLHDSKEFVTLYDVADDLSWKSKENHTIRHFIERIKMYVEQKFNYRIHKVRIST